MPRTREPHYLRRVKTTQTPSQLITVAASASWSGQSNWRIASARMESGVWTRKAERSGESASSFWEAIWSTLSPDRATWIAAADWGFIAGTLDLADALDEPAIELGKVSLSERSVAIKISRRSKSATLINARNLLPDVIGKVMQGCDLGDGSTGAVESQCRKLTAFMRQLMSAVRKYDLGCVQPTIGAWASNCWRHWYRGPQVVIHDSTEALNLERRAYYGGQTLAHKVGVIERHLYGCDINMMYPSEMASWPQPYKLDYVGREATVADLGELTADYGAIADCEVSTSDCVYPVRKSGAMIAAVGNYWTTLAWPELCSGIEQGHIKAIGECAIYRVANLFGEWAERLWRIRQELKADGKDAIASVVKMLGTALHGKLGQHGSLWIDCDTPYSYPWSHWYGFATDGKIVKMRSVGDRTQRLIADRVEPPDSFPAVAAWTTSAGRLAMSVMRDIAGDRHWYYQCTDSLVVDYIGLANLREAGWIDSATLGKAKVDWDCERLEIRGPGWIMHDDRRRASGIGNDAQEVEANQYQRTILPTLASHIGCNGFTSRGPVTRVVNYPPSEIVGTLNSDGWIDPPQLELSRPYSYKSL